MPRVCPHCNVLSHFTREWSDSRYPKSVRISVFCETCDNCGNPVCGTSAMMGQGEKVWPTVVARRTYLDVPGPIAAAASEAHQALAALAPRACVAMARSVVEATAKGKGITEGTLQAKINRLAADGHISEAMKEAAHEIRFAGNEAAHGDLVDEPISVAEATEVTELMDAILERVYQEPAKVERVRASREARRNRQETAQVAG